MKFIFVILSFCVSQLTFVFLALASVLPSAASSATLSLAVSSVLNTNQIQKPSLVEQTLLLANQNNAKTQYHLGMLFNNGTGGTKKDPTQAFLWFQKAADNGHALAQYKLGCYYAGQFASQMNLPIDREKALKFTLLAANAGYSLAQYDVALIYTNQKDWKQAAYWSKHAADQGELMAILFYASFVNTEKYEHYDPVMAWAYGRIGLNKRQLDMQSGKPQLSKNINADENIKLFLNKLSTSFTDEENDKAKNYVEIWREKPSEITIEAMLGILVLEELLKQPK